MEWMWMPLKRYADFSGRSRRMEFWMWVVFQVLIFFVFIILVIALGGAMVMSGDIRGGMAMGGIILILYLLYSVMQLAFLVPGLAVTIRRLHDTNRSGWWILVAVIPYAILGFMMARSATSTDMSGQASVGLFGIIALIGGVVLLVFMILAGTAGDNRYGPDPYAGGTASSATG